MGTNSVRTTFVILVAVALFPGVAVALLNTGSLPQAAAATCGGGGTNPTPTPSSSPSPSSGGGLPTGLPTLPLPGGSSSSPSSTPSATPTSGGGGPVECPSKISIKYDPPGPQEGAKAGFSGKVTSDSNVCIKGRNVIVKKDARRDKKIGTTVTNRRGVWKLPVQKAKGKYYAKTPARRVITSDDTEYQCGAAKSKTIRV